MFAVVCLSQYCLTCYTLIADIHCLISVFVTVATVVTVSASEMETESTELSQNIYWVNEVSLLKEQAKQ